MATEAQLIQTRLAQIMQELVDIGSQGPQPDYSEDGTSVSMTPYRLSLLTEQKQLREQLQAAEGPRDVYGT